jgi:DNA-binding transcriptional ArsR family regulator
MIRDAYVAIADPTRREILDLLRDREVVAAGEIASQFRGVSRPAVSRHLRILRECGVVNTFKHGKTHNYSLNPAPINEIRQGWLSGFARKQMRSLKSLREIVESDS